MAVTTVAQLAQQLNRQPAALLEQLQSAGVSKQSPDDALTETDKERLLEFLRQSHGTAGGAERKKITIVTIAAADHARVGPPDAFGGAEIAECCAAEAAGIDGDRLDERSHAGGCKSNARRRGRCAERNGLDRSGRQARLAGHHDHRCRAVRPSRQNGRHKRGVIGGADHRPLRNGSLQRIDGRHVRKLTGLRGVKGQRRQGQWQPGVCN